MNRLDEVLAELRQQHPAWEIWRVDRYIGGWQPNWPPTVLRLPLLRPFVFARASRHIETNEWFTPADRTFLLQRMDDLKRRDIREFLMVTWLSQKAGHDDQAAAEVRKRINALRTGTSRRDWQPY